MLHLLPKPIERNVTQTLAQWRHWRCDPPLKEAPTPTELLRGGQSNYSILVTSAFPKRQFVVRIDGLDIQGLGLNRQAEWRCLNLAADQRLAPKPRYFNPDLGSMVCDYLVSDPAPVAPSSQLADTAALLRSIHELPAIRFKLNLRERIARYERLIARKGMTVEKELVRCGDAISRLLETIVRKESQSNTQDVLCHNDLLAANRLYRGGTLWAIDWEYCAMGSRWYDLAVVTHGDDLSDSESDRLLEHYLQSPPDDEVRSLLGHYGCVYRYMELLWYSAATDKSESCTPGQRAARVGELISEITKLER